MQSCDRPINTICRRQQTAAVSTPVQRKEKFLHIPEGKHMLLASQKVKEYKIKGQVHALPETVAQNLSWYQKLLDSAQKFYSNSVRPSTKKTYRTGQKRWFVVAEIIGTDPLMQMIPKE
jgi:hypothetical protein